MEEGGIMQIRRYTANDAAEWDKFIDTSKNGTFLFKRSYMDYHSDRFRDHSLMFYDYNEHLCAVLPANEVDDVLWSHQGLTYGGMVVSPRLYSPDAGKVFHELMFYLKNNGFRKMYYKAVPHIYHRQPAEECEYWLWRYRATLESCLISTTIPLHPSIPLVVERRRKRGVKKAELNGLQIRYDAPLSDFWPILVANLLERYNVSPVHSLEEMQLLQSRFPDRIRCHTVANEEGTVVAGVVLYLCNERVVHSQYGHATEEGKQLGALDLLYMTIIDDYRKNTNVEFFDFGNSNERGGYYLNQNLICQKEGFGGRGVTYDTYIVNVK